jgi:PAS domain S-box-containing protein
MFKFIKSNIVNFLITLSILVCLLSLIGLAYNIQFLKNFSIHEHWVNIKPITPFALISIAISLYFISVKKFQNISNAIILVSFIISLIVIINNLTGADLLHISSLLNVPIKTTSYIQIASLEIFLICSALLLFQVYNKKWLILSEIILTISFFIAAVSFVGYTYSIGKLQDNMFFDSMAFQASLCLMLLTFTALKISPAKFILGIYLKDTNLSKVSRKYVFLVILIILFMGWMNMYGQRRGWFSPEVGLGLLIIGFVLTCFFIVRDGVRIISLKEEVRLRAEQLKLENEVIFKTTLDRIIQGFLTIDKNYNITYINKVVADYTEKTYDELVGKNIWIEIPGTVGHQFQLDCFEASSTNKNLSNESFYPPMNKWFDYDIYPNENGLSIFFRDITDRYEYETQIKKSNERFNLINKATDEALWECNLITGELWANETHQKLYGLTINDPVPEEDEWINRIHPDDRAAILSNHDLNLRSKEKVFTSEYRFLSNNEYINIYDRVYFVRDENDSPIRIMGNMMDITHMKKVEEKLEKNKTHLQTILDTTPQCIKLLNKKGELLEMNKSGVEILDASDFGELKNKPVIGLIKESYRNDFRKIIDSVFKGNNEILQFEVTTLKGNTKWLETHSVPLVNKEGTITALLAVTNDITERKKIDLQLKKSFDEVRRLTEHLQNIREEERTFISRELHDELGQQLAAMKMDLAWINKRLSVSEIPIKEKTTALMDQISLLIKSVRKISFDLRPSTLSDFGLSAAIEQYLKDFEERSGIIVHFIKPDLNPELNDTIKTSIYRIFQESLTNISRHAQAKNVFIKLDYFDNKLTLIIKDDGVGFNNEILKSNHTLGILGMKERAVILGGIFDIHSKEGAGTTISIQIPF